MYNDVKNHEYKYLIFVFISLVTVLVLSILDIVKHGLHVWSRFYTCSPQPSSVGRVQTNLQCPRPLVYSPAHSQCVEPSLASKKNIMLKTRAKVVI